MSWMDKLERKIGKYAIRNITKYLVIATIIGYILSMVAPWVLALVMFDPGKILHGQVWRLVTWIIMPTGSGSILGLIFLICLLSMGNSLEMCLGTFRMNVFMIGGLLLSLVGGLVVYAITAFTPIGAVPMYLTPYYVLLMVFMALALCMPDAQVLFMFIIPIKMKWMFFITLVELGYEVFSYFRYGYLAGGSGANAVKAGFMTCWVYGGQILLALLNLALFFYFVKKHVPWKQRKRQKAFRQQFEPAKPRPGSGIYKHKCAVCGRTELDDPSLTFRFCSKCEGSYEYCNEHLYSHEHVYRS